MNNANYADVLCPGFEFRTGCNALKEPGALVYLGTNRGPVYEVVAIAGSTAWVREPGTFRNEALVPVERMRAAA